MNLEQRILRLERDARRWRRVALGLALAIGGYLAWSAYQPAVAAEDPKATASQKLRVQSLTIVNDKDVEVASFAAKGDGASLKMASTGSPGTLELNTQSEPLVAMEGKGGKVWLWGYGLRMVGDSAITMQPALDAAAARRVDDLFKKTRDGVSMTEEEREVLHRLNYPAIYLGLSKFGGGVINIYNPLAKVVAGMESDEKHEGVVFARDAKEQNTKALGPGH